MSFNLKPMRGKVFVHNFKKGERKIGSIILTNDDGKSHGIRPRWAQILETASDIKGVEKGQWILIEHGRWSRSVTVKDSETNEELEFWQVDYPSGVYCVSNSEPGDETIIDTDDVNYQKTR